MPKVGVIDTYHPKKPMYFITFLGYEGGDYLHTLQGVTCTHIKVYIFIYGCLLKYISYNIGDPWIQVANEKQAILFYQQSVLNSYLSI